MIGTETMNVKINGKSSYADFDLLFKERKIGGKKKFVVQETIPYMNGFYDFSAISGNPAYTNREIKYVFELVGQNQAELLSKCIDAEKWLYGCQMSTIQDDEMSVYAMSWTGTCTDVDIEEDLAKFTITATFVVKP